MKYDDKELDNIHEFLARGGDPEEAELGHLSVQELTVFREGELSSEEAKRIEDHLSSCPECSDLHREIQEFFQPPAGAEGTTGGAAAATDWRELRSRLDRKGWFRPVAPGTRREPQSAPSLRFNRSRPATWRRWTPALAAVLTLAVVGLYFLSQPDRQVTTLDVGVRGSAPEERQIVPLSHDLVLPTQSDESYEEYWVEFQNLATGKVTRFSGLEEDHPSEVLIQGLQRLDPGEYEIRLRGIRDGGEDPVGTYFVELQDP